MLSVSNSSTPLVARSRDDSPVHATDRPAPRWLGWLVALCAIIAGVHAMSPSPVGVFYDDAMYVALGKAIAHGQGYAYLNLPDAPAATHYPPIYPLFLALLWRIAPSFPANVVLFKLANVGFTALAAVGAYQFGRRQLRLPASFAAGGAIAGAVALPSLYLTSMVLSEPLFLALLIPVLLVSERTVERETSLARAFAIGAAIGALSLVRTFGILVAPALVVVLLRRRRWRDALSLTLGTAIVIAPWLWWVHRFDGLIPPVLRGAYGSYTGWLIEATRSGGAEFVRRTIALNASTIWGIVARTFSPWPSPLADALIVTLVAALAAVGAFAERRRLRVSLIFLALYFGVVLIWPFPPIRFIANLWALLVLLPLAGACALWRLAARRPDPALRFATATAAGLPALGLLVLTVQGYRESAWAGLARFQAERIDPKNAWVARHTRSDDVIATEDEVAVYLYTGRHAVPVYASPGRQHIVPQTPAERKQALDAIVTRYRPSFIVVGSDEGLATMDAFAADSSAAFRRAAEIPASLVYVRSGNQRPAGR